MPWNVKSSCAVSTRTTSLSMRRLGRIFLPSKPSGTRSFDLAFRDLRGRLGDSSRPRASTGSTGSHCFRRPHQQRIRATRGDRSDHITGLCAQKPRRTRARRDRPRSRVIRSLRPGSDDLGAPTPNVARACACRFHGIDQLGTTVHLRPLTASDNESDRKEFDKIMEIAEIFDIYWSSDVCIASGLHSDLSRMQAEVGSAAHWYK